MKNFLKILLISILSFSFTNGRIVLAEEVSLSDIDLATEVMNDFILSSAINDNDWKGMTINSHEKIYDANLIEYGYVFNISNNFDSAYGIVIESNDSYIVVEAGVKSESPYKNYNESYKKVYTTPLSYYVVPVNYRSSGILFDTFDDSLVLKNELRSERLILDDIIQAPMTFSSTETTKFLNNYIWQFEYITQQPNKSACIPASFAMALKFLHNIERIVLSYPGYSADMKESLWDSMKTWSSTLNKYTVTDTSAQSGILSWTQSWSNRNITIRRDTYFPTASEFNVVKEEIDGNYPAIIMFYDGVVVSGANHATTMMGYKIDGNNNYVIVADPWTESVTRKTVLWNTSNIYGYLVLYLGAIKY